MYVMQDNVKLDNPQFTVKREVKLNKVNFENHIWHQEYFRQRFRHIWTDLSLNRHILPGPHIYSISLGSNTLPSEFLNFPPLWARF